MKKRKKHIQLQLNKSINLNVYGFDMACILYLTVIILLLFIQF